MAEALAVRVKLPAHSLGGEEGPAVIAPAGRNRMTQVVIRAFDEGNSAALEGLAGARRNRGRGGRATVERAIQRARGVEERTRVGAISASRVREADRGFVGHRTNRRRFVGLIVG